MKRNLSVFLGTMLLSFGLSAALAHADSVQLTLTDPNQYVADTGGTLEFSATVSAPLTNAADVYLNADNYTFPMAGVTPDDSPFYNNFPFFLAPGQSYTGELFDITVPAGTALGVTPGTFTILGGSDDNALSNLSTADFSVTVTPEPSTFLLFGSGLFGVALFAWRKRVVV
jgi:hypothetical protein